MRVVLISPAHPRVENDNLDPPLGAMYLSAVLKRAGHKVKILDFAGHRQHVIPEADIYGFTTYTPTYHWCLSLRDVIKEQYPDAKYIAGGTHVSALPDECSKDWDYVVVGEGERAILALAAGDELPTIIYSKPFMDIDDLPWPDYSYIDPLTYERILENERVLSVFTSRGCPYKCAFCNSIIWHGARKVRFRNPDNVVEEIDYLRETFDIHNVRFIDDLFAISNKRVRELTLALKPLGIKYRCTGRCNLLNSEMANMLVDSGCVQIEFGVESGADSVLKRMNKHQTGHDAIHAIHTARAAGLRTRAYLIMGFPGETWDTVKQTCDVMLEARPDEVLIHTAIPFPGTPLYKDPESFGITWIEKDFTQYMQISKDRQPRYLISHETADRDTIKEMWEYTVAALSSITWYAGKK